MTYLLLSTLVNSSKTLTTHVKRKKQRTPNTVCQNPNPVRGKTVVPPKLHYL